MKTICLTLITLLALEPATSTRRLKSKRGYNLGSIDDSWQPSNPGQSGWIDDYLQVDLAAPSPQLSVLHSNDLDKPVIEPQEFIPSQSQGQRIIPRMPPPATPVNAVASNVPAQTGAVFLGSGALGVINLGNGAYALGSGSIGYSGNRAQPRPNGMAPLFPQLPASPDLIPAAVPSAQPPQGPGFNINYNPAQVPQYDQNGYEYLPPDRIGFGTPLARLPMVKVRQQFATPTSLRVQPQQQPQFQQVPQVQNQASFDLTIPFNSHPTALGI